MSGNDPNAHVRSYLDYYVAMEEPPQFAVLITGSWGVGKTWLVQDYIEPKRDKFVYITAYGAKSIGDIGDRIFAALNPILASRAVALGSRIVKGLLKGALKIDLNDDVSAEATADPSNISLPRATISLGKRTLIIDDVERCAVQGPELWGFINCFVEREKSKIILLSSEVNEQMIHQSMRERYEAPPEVPDWQRFRSFRLTDAQFDSLLDETWSKLVRREYRSLGPLLNVVSHHTWAAVRRISRHTEGSIVKEAIASLNDLTPNALARFSAAPPRRNAPSGPSTRRCPHRPARSGHATM